MRQKQPGFSMSRVIGVSAAAAVGMLILFYVCDATELSPTTIKVVTITVIGIVTVIAQVIRKTKPKNG